MTWFFSPSLFELYQAHEGCDKMLVCVSIAQCSVSVDAPSMAQRDALNYSWEERLFLLSPC